MVIRDELDKLVKTYETVDFIKDDPIQFPHRFSHKNDIEIAAFISSFMSYGTRTTFVEKLHFLFDNIIHNEPYNFIINFEPEVLGSFNYRFGKPRDFAQIFNIMSELYKFDGGLEQLFKYGHDNPVKNNIFIPVTDYFYSKITDKDAKGFVNMIPNARKGSAMKRMCMFLRWMVRKGPVDLGIWNFMKPSELLIPLDTHVIQMARTKGLLTRKATDLKAAREITDNLRKFDPEDPTKYDFAMFGYGVNNK